MHIRILSTFLALAIVLAPLPSFAIAPGLTVGSRGQDVKELQRTLADIGLFDGDITGFFGALTKRAVISLQEAYADLILAPANLNQGTGYVGSLTAAVLNASTTPTLIFAATQTNIVAGQQTKLGWKSTGTATCTASGGWSGDRARIQSNYVVTPLTTTTYTLTCANGDQTVSRSVTITVRDEVTLTFYASHPSIVAGQGTTLLWKATNYTSCVASGGWSDPTKRLVYPTTSTIYTLSCSNANKTVSQSVTVTVAGTKPPVALPPGTVSNWPTPVTPPKATSTPNTPTVPTLPVPPTPPATTTPQTPTVGTYYIDFASGSDTNAGTKESPWKHAPGDPEATGNPGKTVLKPGDVVQFKGGVTYYGSVKVNGSGTSGNPVVFSGEGWGSGKAIIDGSQPVTTWSRCTSASDCAGNPNWSQIYKARIDVPTFLVSAIALRLNVTEGDQPLAPAQAPAPLSPYYPNPEPYFSVPKEQVTATSITDSRIGSLGGSLLAGTYAYVWGVPNETAVRRITRVSGSTIFLSEAFNPYTDRNTKYAIVNAPTGGVFDTAGEYYFDDSTRTLYVWPRGGNPNGSVSYSVRSYGIDLNTRNYVEVTGFKIQKQTGDAVREGAGIVKFVSAGSQGLHIANNEVTLTQSSSMGGISIGNTRDLLIEDNYVHDLRGNMRGIQVGASSNVRVLDNRLRNISRTGIYFAAVDNGLMRGNVMTDSNSTHGNGLTVYQGSSNVTVDRNTVSDANIAFTMERSSNVTITNNVFDGANHTGAILADWGSMTGTVTIKNNSIVNSNTSGSVVLNSKSVRYILDHNILEGAAVSPVATYTNNLYTEWGHFQSARYGWTAGPGEQLVPPSDLFVAPGTTNYRVKPAYAGYGASR